MAIQFLQEVTKVPLGYNINFTGYTTEVFEPCDDLGSMMGHTIRYEYNAPYGMDYRPAEQAVRTIICREIVPGPKKDRWHPLFTTSVAEAVEVLSDFRVRQHHEQAYRIGVHDEMLDAVPCGYDKDSPDPERPRLQRGGLQMVGWLVALMYNAVANVAVELSGNYVGSHIRTLRRTFFNRPGTLHQTPEALIVQLDPFNAQEALSPLIDDFNALEHRLAWLGNRRVVLTLTQTPPR